MYSVYAIFNQECKKIYIGQTKDLNTRLYLHDNKFFKNSYTSRFKGDWKLVYKEDYVTRKKLLKEKSNQKVIKADYL